MVVQERKVFGLEAGEVSATLVPRAWDSAMAWFKKDKEKERYYLLPGMGGRNLRRKQAVILKWTLAAGLLVAAAFGALLYLLNH